MARQQGTQVVNTFVGGLHTEATALSFPDKACTETWNCVFDETGRITRRLGIDIEETGTAAGVISTPVATAETEAWSEYRWDAVAGEGSRTFLVQHFGRFIHFFDVSETTEVEQNYHSELELDLDDFIPAGSGTNYRLYPCQFASGRGKLLIVNRGTDPILVTYDPIANTMTGETIEIRIRDFSGLDDGLEDGDRPTTSVADLITNNPEHYYNILNQSWFIGDALSQWDTARTDVPSNRDYVALSRESQDDAFDNAAITANSPGSRLAPKGHFILNAWCPDHNTALSDEGFSGTIGQDTAAIALSSLTTIGNPQLTLSAAFDGDTTETAATCTRWVDLDPAWIGKSLSQPTRIAGGVIYGSSDTGLVDNNGGIVVDMYAKQGTAPANSTDGDILETLAFNDTSDESAGRVMVSDDTDTFFDHVWVRISDQGAGAITLVAELTFDSFLSQSAGLYCTVERPTCVEFFAGRAWYAGTNFGQLSSNIYFSQIVTNDRQYGRCYQANDPASEDFTDLLPDDGGVIVIPEIATVVRLFAYQSALLVLATNGVWLITGGSQGGFLATDFIVKRLSDEGTNSPQSVLSYKGVPAWFGENGIFTIQFDANYQSFSVVSMSDQKIKSFVDDIPRENYEFVKGAFNTEDGTGYWLYGQDRAGWDYDRLLVVNGLSGAFYPWTIELSSEEHIRGICYVKSPAGGLANIKLTSSSDDTETMYFSEARQTSYKDWSLLAVLRNADLELDYDSYFITGYKLEGQAIRFFQPNYIIVYNENEDGCGSCFVQGVYDFATSGDSGKWSTRQQVFNNCLTHRNVTYARRKIRGKGRALQLRFSSETGKPFTIIGWAVWITGNAGV